MADIFVVLPANVKLTDGLFVACKVQGVPIQRSRPVPPECGWKLSGMPDKVSGVSNG